MEISASIPNHKASTSKECRMRSAQRPKQNVEWMKLKRLSQNPSWKKLCDIHNRPYILECAYLTRCRHGNQPLWTKRSWSNFSCLGICLSLNTHNTTTTALGICVRCFEAMLGILTGMISYKWEPPPDACWRYLLVLEHVNNNVFRMYPWLISGKSSLTKP